MVTTRHEQQIGLNHRSWVGDLPAATDRGQTREALKGFIGPGQPSAISFLFYSTSDIPDSCSFRTYLGVREGAVCTGFD